MRIFSTRFIWWRRMIVIAWKLEDEVIDSMSSGFAFGFSLWPTLPDTFFRCFVCPILGVLVISTVNNDSSSQAWMRHSRDVLNKTWNQFSQEWVYFQIQSVQIIGWWRMIMITRKLEDEIIESMSPGFTFGFVLWPTPPDSFLGFFVYPINGVLVISTVNNDGASQLWTGCSSDAFNIIWNQFIQE